MTREEPGKVLCRHMTSYGECTLTEEPCVQGPCSLEEPEEWVRVVRCAGCGYTRPPRTRSAAAKKDVFRCENTKSPCFGRLVYESDFCSYGAAKEDA